MNFPGLEFLRIQSKVIYLFIYLLFSHNKDYTSITLYKDVARGPQKTTRLIEGERKLRRGVFTYSIKRSVREFHVIVMQWWQRNEQKSAMRVWSSCFTHRLFNVLVAVANLITKG